MPRGRSDRPAQLAGYWLSKRPGSAMWCRTWFDGASRQTCRASLSTDDLAAAEKALAGWIVQNVATRRAEPDDITLGRIFLRYEAEHVRGPHAAGATAQRRSLAMILQHVPSGATVAQFGIRGQEAARAAMEAAGYGPWTIKRAFGAAKAAINWAWQREELARPVPFIKLEDGDLRERVLSVAELARLWGAEMPDHVRTFIAVMLGTCARPEAALQLTRFQCDLVQGVVNLNPAGRKQTKKRRPMLPLASWLRPFIQAAAGHLVAYRGRPIQKIAGAFQTVRDAAGFGPDVTAYTLRHTVATELKRRGVSVSDVASVLGHKAQEFRTTEGYIHVMGETVASLRAALDDLENDIARAATRAMEPIQINQVRASCVLVADWKGGNPTRKPEKTGAAVGTGIQLSLGLGQTWSKTARPFRMPRQSSQNNMPTQHELCRLSQGVPLG